MRRSVYLGRGRWSPPRPAECHYKCVGGCGTRVEKPFNICLTCKWPQSDDATAPTAPETA